MDMYNIRMFPPSPDNCKKGMNNGFNTFIVWGKDMTQLDTLPLFLIILDVWCASSQDDFMARGNNTWIQFLTVLFNTARNVRNTSGAGYKYFHQKR